MVTEIWNLLNDVRKFIETEYADPAAAPNGEWLVKDARDIHDKVCIAIANVSEALSQTGVGVTGEAIEIFIGPYYYMPMPVNTDGEGPADVEDTHRILHQVWDSNCSVVCECRDEVTARWVAKQLSSGEKTDD